VPFIHSGPLFRPWFNVNTTRAVKAGMVIYVPVINYRAVNIGIMDHRSVYVHDSGVIPEVSSRPHAAAKTEASITETIIDTAVETYLGAPVTTMVPIVAAVISPIGWRP